MRAIYYFALAVAAVLILALVSGCSADSAAPPSVLGPHLASHGAVDLRVTTRPIPVTDETAAVQALLNAGGAVQLECRDYYFSATLHVGVSGTTLQGCGKSTVLHWTQPAPGTGVACKNGSAIQILCGLSFYTPRAVSASIKAGDTFMEVADSSGLQVGDWLMVGDWGVLGTYTASVDWVQVGSINGNTVGFAAPIRVAIPLDPPFSPYQHGAGYVRMIDLHDVTLQDFTIKITAGVDDPYVHNFPAIYPVGTRNTTMRRLVIDNPAGNPFTCYFCKSPTIEDNEIVSQGINTEIASAVDAVITGNTWDTGDLSLDLGAAFFTLANNRFLAPFNIGIYTTDNVHDGVISGNTIGYVGLVGGFQNAVGMLITGSPNIAITGNTFLGGAGKSIGIEITPQVAGAYAWPDTGDVLTNNSIQGFAIPTRIL